jgi:hypothetical protein
LYPGIWWENLRLAVFLSILIVVIKLFIWTINIICICSAMKYWFALQWIIQIYFRSEIFWKYIFNKIEIFSETLLICFTTRY